MTASVGGGDVAACSRRTAAAQPPTSLRPSARSPAGFVYSGLFAGGGEILR